MMHPDELPAALGGRTHPWPVLAAWHAHNRRIGQLDWSGAAPPFHCAEPASQVVYV